MREKDEVGRWASSRDDRSKCLVQCVIGVEVVVGAEKCSGAARVEEDTMEF